MGRPLWTGHDLRLRRQSASAARRPIRLGSNGLEHELQQSRPRQSHFKDHYDHGFSPRIGLTVHPFRGFRSTATSHIDRREQRPERSAVRRSRHRRGEQFEGGVKAEFFDGRLSASAAYFDITKTNVPQANPANPDTRCSWARCAARASSSI